MIRSGWSGPNRRLWLIGGIFLVMWRKAAGGKGNSNIARFHCIGRADGLAADLGVFLDRGHAVAAELFGLCLRLCLCLSLRRPKWGKAAGPVSGTVKACGRGGKGPAP